MTEMHQSASDKVSFFKILFDQSPFAMQIYSADGDVVKTNEAWDTFWGRPTLDSVSHYNIYKDKQAQSVGFTAAFKQALTGTSTNLYDAEYDPTLSGLTGSKRYLHVRILPLAQDGQVEGILCVLEDNTEHKQAEQERRNYQERLEQEVALRTRHLEALLEFSTELTGMSQLAPLLELTTAWTKKMLRFDCSTLFLISEETGHLVLEKTIGFPAAMVGSFFLLEGEGLPSLVARDRKTAVIEDFHTETRIAIPEIIFKHKLTSALAVPMLNKNELIGVLVGHTIEKRSFSNSDISLYQNVANQAAGAIVNTMHQRNLQRSEARFRNLFENANDAIYLVDSENRQIVDCNQKALLLEGCSRSEITAMKMYDHYPAEEREQLDHCYRQVLQKGSYTNVDVLHHIKKDTTQIPVEISSSLVETNGRKLIMRIVRDVSNRVALEQARKEKETKNRHANRMEAIGLMAGGVAHDLNNILSGVVSYPELIMMQLPEDSPICESLQVVIDSGQRAAAVVADLLTVARGSASVKELTCLDTLISNYMESAELRKVQSLYPEIDFILKPVDDVKEIECSVVHIQKVLLNLVTNAAESIKGSGQVEIATCNRIIKPEDSSPELPAGEYTALCVQDSGSGVSQHDLEHIFDPFYTTKKMGRSGTGLGLSVVWNTVQDHDGFINVSSNAGGTLFTLFLPSSSLAGSSKSEQSKNSISDLQGKGSILVVDDEQVLRDVALKVLTSLGYRVTTVCSGKQAVSFIKQQAVDLVVLDMLMDPGINGRQTFEQIIRIRPQQKAIVISGYSESDDIKRVMELGVHCLLKKPYTIEELGRTVQEALLEEKGKN